MRLRLLFLTIACVLIAVGAFIWLHSGGPGDATCERFRFVPSDGFSAWPPGAQCRYGEPMRTDTIINDWFAVVVVALGFLFAVLRATLISRTRALSLGRALLR